jgi:ATP-binding cassette subfamily F protein uup
MTLLLSCQSLSKSFGPRLLFQNLNLSVFSKDRIGLIGPNGSGKTTLLKIIAGQEKEDEGILSLRKDLSIGYLPQSCDFPDITLEAVLLQALDASSMDSYEKENRVEIWLDKLGFSSKSCSAAHLSGGWKKRLGLAKELLLSPDLLLLDEPTNHLDLEGILWLEQFLQSEAPAYLLVSHDRYFLQNTTNRIIEIDASYPTGIFSISGDYAHFLEKKEQFLEGQIQQERSVATKARRETEWLRQGVKARTTKSQARIDEAYEIQKEHAAIQNRNRQRRSGIDFSASERETQKLIVAKNLSKKMGERNLFKHLDLTLSPNLRLGLMGPNGSGKTTLLRLLANEITPDQGTLKFAEDVKIVYFDQHRTQLSLELTLREALSPHGDYVLFRGKPVHVNGWCKRFLFSPDLLDLKLSKLSGGERARIAIAHLMLQPADVLLLDEPTNDLDIPTLETLEESLIDFPGAVVLITHDRCMIDRICNSLLALGDLETPEFYADFSQWHTKQLALSSKKEKKSEEKGKTASTSYANKKAQEQIERKILKSEEEIKKLNQLLENPEIAEDMDELSRICAEIRLLETQLEKLYIQWEELFIM